MSKKVATIRSSNANAKVYQREYRNYYFCCKTCGNCGPRRSWLEDAMADASAHVLNANHAKHDKP